MYDCLIMGQNNRKVDWFKPYLSWLILVKNRWTAQDLKLSVCSDWPKKQVQDQFWIWMVGTENIWAFSVTNIYIHILDIRIKSVC